jgi:hypothetical protein
MASTTTGNAAVQIPPVYRARCGTGGNVGAGHASLRAFAAAHAVFGAPAQLGHDSAARHPTCSTGAAPPAPLFVFGDRSSTKSPAAAAARDDDGRASANCDAAAPADAANRQASCRAADSHSPSPFVTAVRERKADVSEAPAKSSLFARPPTVFGPSAPSADRPLLDASPSPVAPKRAREVPAVDDVTSMLALCVTTDLAADFDRADVDRAAELLAGCCVPGKRPRTTGGSAARAGNASTFAAEEPAARVGKGEIAYADSKENAVDTDADTGLSGSLSTSPSEPVAVDPVGGDAEEHDDDELSFLVTRCDIDCASQSEWFMPYIS